MRLVLRWYSKANGNLAGEFYVMGTFEFPTKYEGDCYPLTERQVNSLKPYMYIDSEAYCYFIELESY